MRWEFRPVADKEPTVNAAVASLQRLGGFSRARLVAIAACGLVAIVALVWFFTIPHVILMGDDVVLVYSVLHGQYASNLEQALTTVGVDKYRPVLNVVFAVIIPLFRAHAAAYETLNVLLELANTALLARIVWLLSRRHAALTVAAAIGFVVCRFAYYNVVQVIGVMEGMGILFTLLTVLDAIRAYRENRLWPLARCVLWYALVTFTDERYLVLGLFVVLCVVLHPRMRFERRVSGLLGAGAVGVLVLNVGLKALVFHSAPLTGTGGRAISASSTIPYFMWTGLQNVLGFNAGPDYLSGKDVAALGFEGYALGALVAIPALVVFGAYAVAAWRERSLFAARAAVLFAALFVPLLLSSAITIRQEFRWLYVPEAVLFIALAAAAPRARLRRFGPLLAIVAFSASALGAVFYRPFLENVFFMNAMSIASDVHDEIVRAGAAPVAVADHGNASLSNWIFMNGEFFALYGFDANGVQLVAEPADVRRAGTKIISIVGDHAITVERPVPPIAGFRNTVRSFIDTFAQGKLNSRRPVDTPTKTGALLLPWRSGAQTVMTLTVVASYRYTYTVPVRAHEALAFYATRPYPNGSPTHAFVTVAARGRHDTVYDQMLQPLPTIVWDKRIIDLSRYAGSNAQVTFGADAPTDQNAAWIAFAYPSVVNR